MKSILITGASRGLGFALVKAFYECDYKVFAVVRGGDAYEKITAMFPNVSVLIADVTSDSYQKALSEFLDKSTVDVVINNAGTGGTSGIDTLTSTGEQLVHEFRTHCVGALSTVKGALTNLASARSPLIVNISSRKGSLGMQSEGAVKNVTCSFSYRIAKASQNMLSLCMADDLESLGIKVVALHPGALLTDMAPVDAHLTPEKSASMLLKLVQNDDMTSREFVCLESGNLQW